MNDRECNFDWINGNFMGTGMDWPIVMRELVSLLMRGSDNVREATFHNYGNDCDFIVQECTEDANGCNYTRESPTLRIPIEETKNDNNNYYLTTASPCLRDEV